MFYVADDEKRIVDSHGRVLGWLNGEKFTQLPPVPSPARGGLEFPDEVYRQGLSPLEMEMVSETIQRNKTRGGGDGEVV